MKIKDIIRESYGPERYPGIIPLGAYNSHYDREFSQGGNYRDVTELIKAVEDLIDAGVEPVTVTVDPKKLLATQDWLSNDGGDGALFDEYPDLPVVYERDGSYYILDGHHRVTRALKRGANITVYLFEQDTELDEANIDYGIEDVMIEKGYKMLGSGMDQDAYLAPDGTVVKIFGYPNRPRDRKKQQSFIDFAAFCKANPDNQFLPDIIDWARFEFKGKPYLQIRTERLFPIDENYPNIGPVLEQLVIGIYHLGVEGGIRHLFRMVDKNDMGQFTTLVGDEADLKLFATTIEQLKKIADSKGYGLDLHSGNFMFGSDGTLVINDPFYTG